MGNRVNIAGATFGRADGVPEQAATELFGSAAVDFAKRQQNAGLTFNGYGIGDYTAWYLTEYGFYIAATYCNVKRIREGAAGMNELLPMITERDGIPVTTSRAVAEQFGKNHKEVLRAIENTITQLKETDEGKAFNERNFAPISLRDAMNREKPAYLLTRDGFTLLAMGFTGAKAVQFKVAYINAFNRMERLIRGGGVSAPAPALKSIERRLEALEQATGAQTADLSEVGATFLQAIRAAIESGEYYISRPYSKTAETGKQLGRRERTETVLIAKTAYKVYAEYTAHPLARLTLWSVLEQIGTIEARERDSAPMVASFKECKAGAIYIKNEKLERR